METTFVTTTQRTLLPAVRSVLHDASEAYLAVAFVAEAGVHLIHPQLQKLGSRGRLISTTVFGITSTAGLTMARNAANVVRVLNPLGSRTYHPKLYLGRRGQELSAVIGSANLTAGLVANVEAGVWLRGTVEDQPLREAWEWADQTWCRPEAVDWTPAETVAISTGFSPALLAMIRAAVAVDPVFMTLGANPKANKVVDLTESDVWVETERSKGRHGGAEPIPAWMVELAWETLKSRGELTNTELLNELRVHRSSAVCAILARLPGVVVLSKNPIKLGFT